LSGRPPILHGAGTTTVTAQQALNSPKFVAVEPTAHHPGLVGLDQAKVIHRPRLLSDNGSSYIAADLAKWLDGQNMAHIRGAPYHPTTQGKIERCLAGRPGHCLRATR
jgi:transposase InsO family protein